MNKMYEIKITFPIQAETPDKAIQEAVKNLGVFLDDTIFDAPEIVREIPPEEAEQYEAVNQDE